MLTRSFVRVLTLAAIAFAAMATSLSTPAYAEDPTKPVNCTARPNAPGCKVTVGTPGRPGGSHGNDSNASTGDGGEDPSTCRWVKTDGGPPPAGADAGSGGWYMKVCGSQGSFLGTAPQWVENPPEPVDPAVLARQATADLKLPSPRIRANPNPNVDLLVRVPVWMWVDASSWGARSATASVPGVSVTATATPTQVRWEMGDGTTVTCRGAGTAWKAGMDPRSASPDCGHVYRRSSASASGDRFSLRATVTWTVSWQGGGSSGTLPALTTTDALSVRVAESQAINGGALG
jgi:hypothetical protein